MANVNLQLFRMSESLTNINTAIDDDADNANLIQISTYLDGEELPRTQFTSLVSYTIHDTRTQTMNPLPFEDEARKPDTGFSGTRYTLELMFYDLQSAGLHPDITKIRTWMREPQINDDFHEGLIGIRNDFERNYNLVPVEGAGFRIIDFHLQHVLKTPTIKHGTLVLEFSGDPSNIGDPISTVTTEENIKESDETSEISDDDA